MEFLSWLENTQFCTWIRGSGSIWAYPLVLTLHTTGMGILVGFNWALDLRLLGVARQIPVLAMEKFFKVMWIGFWVNLVTGIVLLAADATTKMTSWVFGVKMFFIVLAMIVLVKLEKTVFRSPASARQTAGGTASSAGLRLQTSAQTSRTGLQAAAVLEPSLASDQFLPANAKLLAILSLVFWTISITAGRLMAYLGPQTGIK
jgi:hypothetical protein